jgi:hypothetical protein
MIRKDNICIFTCYGTDWIISSSAHITVIFTAKVSSEPLHKMNKFQYLLAQKVSAIITSMNLQVYFVLWHIIFGMVFFLILLVSHTCSYPVYLEATFSRRTQFHGTSQFTTMKHTSFPHQYKTTRITVWLQSFW